MKTLVEQERNRNTLVFLSFYFMAKFSFPKRVFLLNTLLFTYINHDLYYHMLVMGIDMIIHHIITILLISASIYQGVEWKVMKPFYQTEISTIFLVFSNLRLFSKALKNIFKITFVMTFVYYRIYGIGLVLLSQTEMNPAIFFGFGLWFLNIYWFSIICKKIISIM